MLTLPQTINYGLFQTERLQTTISNSMEMAEISLKKEKKKKKL